MEKFLDLILIRMEKLVNKILFVFLINLIFLIIYRNLNIDLVNNFFNVVE